VQIADLNKRVDSLNTVLSTTRDNSAKEIGSLNDKIKEIADELTNLQTSNAKVTEENEKLKTDLGELTQQNLALEAKLKAIETPYLSVLGSYYSLQLATIAYAGSSPPGESIVTLTIAKKEDNTLIAEFIYLGNIPYGCSGHHTKTQAEIQGVERLTNNSYKLQLKQTSCNYTYGQNCDDPSSEIDYSENESRINPTFFLTIYIKNNNQVKIESTASQGKCLYAWDFSKFSFYKDKFIEGEKIWYFDDDLLRVQGKTNYVNGIEEGEAFDSHPFGHFSYKGNYLNGLKEGEWVEYHFMGQLAAKGNYVNGKLEGEWKYFSEEARNEEGIWQKTETYKNGKLINCKGDCF
jgi:antitoxin component YwqK of YwqJK toxin-antitoxin module